MLLHHVRWPPTLPPCQVQGMFSRAAGAEQAGGCLDQGGGMGGEGVLAADGTPSLPHPISAEVRGRWPWHRDHEADHRAEEWLPPFALRAVSCLLHCAYPPGRIRDPWLWFMVFLGCGDAGQRPFWEGGKKSRLTPKCMCACETPLPLDFPKIDYPLGKHTA